jgi:hypothetical protein
MLDLIQTMIYFTEFYSLRFDDPPRPAKGLKKFNTASVNHPPYLHI